LTQVSTTGSNCSHPADPENNDPVDRALLAEVLQLGFEEAIAILAISKTKGVQSTSAVSRQHKMVFVVNMSLKMGTGKLAAQVGHATLGVYRLAQRSEDRSTKLPSKSQHAFLMCFILRSRFHEYICALPLQCCTHFQGQNALEAWRMFGEMKVVVKGHNTEMLLDIFKQAKDSGLFAYIVSDAGRTQIPAGSRTVLSVFGPSEVVDTVTGQLKLL
uniref:peptidyl-tRNA hydrolase n=1 Tax=Gongylonema pulchrum TaxID=637853 RepID=A0A183ENL0_9BILA